MRLTRARNKLLFGVAKNDADYVTEHREWVDGRYISNWICPYLSSWKAMLFRCYSEKALVKRPTYSGCSVCDEWLTFSNFKKWMEKQEWKGKELDKDILVFGNKIYSPSTCAFVLPATNKFITDCAAARGDMPIGVRVRPNGKRFQARCNNPFTLKREHLGDYDDAESAHNAWKARKREHAAVLSLIETNPKVSEALKGMYL